MGKKQRRLSAMTGSTSSAHTCRRLSLAWIPALTSGQMWHPKGRNSVSRIIGEDCEAPFLARRRKYLHDLETEGIIEDNDVPS